MDCLLYYELVERSYENALLLKCELERRGYKVKICNLFWRDFWKCLFYRPKILILSACRDTEQLSKQIPFLFIKRLVLVNLQEEQVAYSSGADLDLFLPKGRAKEAHHFCWGKFSMDNMKQAMVTDEHIVPVSPIQFDMCRREWKDYFFSREKIAKEFSIDTEKKWVLFAADFCITSICVDEDAIKEYTRKFSDIYETTYHAEKRIQATLYEWWDRYLSTHDDVIIIYRPHPSEYRMHEFAKDLCKKHTNFIYCKKYSIKQWLHVIDIYTTWISTSVMEAYYCDLPCFALGDSEDIVSNGIAISLFDYSKYVSTYDTFERILDHPQEEKEAYAPLSFENVRNVYGNTSEKPAYIQMCDYLETILKDKKLQKEMQVKLTRNEMSLGRAERWHYVWITFYNDLFYALRHILWYIIPHKRNSIIKFENDLKRFDEKELREKERRIKKLLESRGKVLYGSTK